MDNTRSLTEQAAWQRGFLYGQYADEFRYEHELVATNQIPYAAGTPEYDQWLKGYLSNLD